MGSEFNVLDHWQKGALHFVGLAGTGMSAIARFLNQNGHEVSGSDRQFKENAQAKAPFATLGISCHDQDGSGIDENTFGLCVSTAVESHNVELVKAKQRGLPVWHRSEVLAWIASRRKTIAISGTSGKSTVTAMVFHMLRRMGYDPSVISGAPLHELGPGGNFYGGKGEWLVLEADESDGSLVQYQPEVGVMLNLDRDHKELDELENLFRTFRSRSKHFVTWADQSRCRPFSTNQVNDFGEDPNAGFSGRNYEQVGWSSVFDFREEQIEIPFPGRHTMWNALAAVAALKTLGVDPLQALKSLRDFKGVWRRHIKLIDRKGLLLVDDFAHNPAKIQAAIETCQALKSRLVAWFQPHGFGPTKFMRSELVERLQKILRPDDEIWLAPIYYAGGTADRSINSEEIVEELLQRGVKSRHIPKSSLAEQLDQLDKKSKKDLAILLMGARDPSLEEFSELIKVRIESGL